MARRLGECCESVTVASGDGQRLAWLGLPQVADAIAYLASARMVTGVALPIDGGVQS